MKWLAALSVILLTIAAVAYFQIEPAPTPATAPAQGDPLPQPERPPESSTDTHPVAPPPPAAQEPPADTARLIQDIERALISVDESERDRVYMQLLPELIARDANAAARLVDRTAPGQVRAELLSHVARLWAANDLEGAISWASKLKDDGERTIAATEMTAQLARTNPGNAIELADLFDIGRDNGSVVHMAQMWATENLDAALKWIRAQSPGARRDQLLARIVVVQAATDPRGAASTALGQLPAGPLREDAVLGIVRQWGYSDAESAAAWVERLPEPELRDKARKELALIAQQALGTQ